MVQKIACLGAGYVGAPTSAVIAMKCPDIQVVVLDINAERIAAFNSSKLPIYEPGLQAVVESCRGKNLHFSTDLEKHIAEADMIFVSVNTPTKRTGIGAGAASDLSSWEAAGRSIAKYSSSRKIVVEKSTVPVRTAAALARVLAANRKDEASFDVLSNPEFLAEGTAIQDLLSPDRILIGGEPNSVSGMDAVDQLSSVYARWVPRDRILCMDVWSSELSKLTANAFLAQRISSINAVAHLCERSGADVTAVAQAVGRDTRIGNKFLNASVGFGGSCFKKDILNLVYICETFGLHEVAEYWLQVIKMNEYTKRRFVAKMVKTMFNTLRGKRIAVFGFAFKKDTADVRETASLDVCLGLLEEGAQVKVYDPLVDRDSAIWEMKQQQKMAPPDQLERFIFTETPLEAVDGADAIAILTEWDEFKTLDYELFYQKMRKPACIFDGRLILEAPELAKIGFEVRPHGRPASATVTQALPPNNLEDEEGMPPCLTSPMLPAVEVAFAKSPSSSGLTTSLVV